MVRLIVFIVDFTAAADILLACDDTLFTAAVVFVLKSILAFVVWDLVVILTLMCRLVL